MKPTAIPTFEELPVLLGSTFFSPAIEQVRKFAYAVEDESGWLVGDPADALVHPLFLSTYMWFPSGFYLRAPGEIGHFSLFRQSRPSEFGTPFLRQISGALPAAVPPRPPDPGRHCGDGEVPAAGRDFIVMRASFFDADGAALAVYDHGCAIRSDEVQRAAAPLPHPMRHPQRASAPHRDVAGEVAPVQPAGRELPHP